jgi:hypothetical protein
MLLLRLAPVWFCFLLCFLLARIAAGRNRIIRDWRLYWILAALANGVFLVLIAEIAGAFDSLGRATVAMAWTGVDAALFWLIAWKFRGDVIEMASAGLEDGWFCLIGRKFRGDVIGFDRATRWLYGLGLGFGLFLGVISLQAPTFVWDCKSYHVPRILNWVQDKSLRPFPTSDVRRVAYDPGAEIASTTLYLLDGSDRPINLPSWFSVITSAILASFVTELLAKLFSERTGREWPREKARMAAAFSFLLVLTIPEGLIQAISTENDFVAAMWNLSLACMTVLFLRQPDNLTYAAAIGLSLALGICTKAGTFISAAPFLAGAFVLLAWRRFHGSALKLAGILVVAVALLNAPWLMRNYSVFGRLLGPVSVSGANVNPSFSPDRVLANIFRNLSLYTATPSAMVTKALNNVVRALVFCTGRPLDDPTSVVPYQDPHQALHFALQGPAVIGNGDGLGNVHVWLMLGALLIISGFPLRNALGFHAAGACMGFCLSCLYLRWHPWLFRYHITYFVLAMPIVAIALVATARRAFIVLLALLCLANAVLILAYNTQYPIYAPFLKLSREQHQFGSNLHLHRPYVALAEDIIERGCTNVLLKCETYNFDYGLWVCLQNRGYHGTIEEFLVQNETARLSRWELTPRTAMVFIGSRPSNRLAADIGGRKQPLLGIEYLGYYGSVSALFPSPFPGHWWRLVGPDNHAELSFDLSGANGIGPDKPAEIDFFCKLVDHDDLPLTNNVLRLIVGNCAGDIDLRSGPAAARAIVTQPSFAIRTFLLKPVPPKKYPAYLSNLQLSWKWAEKQESSAPIGTAVTNKLNSAPPGSPVGLPE